MLSIHGDVSHIRFGLGIALLLACFAYVWLAGTSGIAVTLWLVRKAHYR
jgi:hypothetical protein